jgi:hypothetical protein
MSKSPFDSFDELSGSGDSQLRAARFVPFPVKSKEDFSQGREQNVISWEVTRVAIELQEKKARPGAPKINHGRPDVRI